MKKINFTLIVSILTVAILLFSGCSQKNETQTNLSCGEHKHLEGWKVDCNTCTCNNGTISCTEMACIDENQNNDTDLIDEFKEQLNIWKFNANLTTYEKDWLNYLEQKNPNSKIFHIKTKIHNCNECYDLLYKKDREIIKIVIRDGNKNSESKISEITPEIENSDVCTLFGGEWNNCPKLCYTDEEACQTQCGLPICEFDENKLIFKKEGEICGGLDEGDCEYGLTCFYDKKEDEYGKCINK